MKFNPCLWYGDDHFVTDFDVTKQKTRHIHITKRGAEKCALNVVGRRGYVSMASAAYAHSLVFWNNGNKKMTSMVDTRLSCITITSALCHIGRHRMALAD